MYEVRPIAADIYLDASPTGLGGAFGDLVYTLQTPKNFHNYNIVQLEVLNIVDALKIWGQLWQNKHIRIYCDNHAVVDALNTGKARDYTLATCVRNIWLLAVLYNVTIVTYHVYGSHNTVADLLSRWHNTVNNIDKLHAFIPNPIWVNTHLDLTLLNYSKYFFSVSEPGAVTASLATEASARLFKGYRPATMTAYSRYFRDFLAFLVVAGLSLPHVSTIDILAYMEYLHGYGMSP